MMQKESHVQTCSKGTTWNGKPVALKMAFSAATVMRLSSID